MHLPLFELIKKALKLLVKEVCVFIQLCIESIGHAAIERAGNMQGINMGPNLIEKAKVHNHLYSPTPIFREYLMSLLMQNIPREERATVLLLLVATLPVSLSL